VHFRAISFRIIVHAEIESYLEDRAFELLDAAWKHWKASRVPSEVVIGILAFSEVKTSLPPDSLGLGASKQSYDDLSVPLDKAQNVWRTNHKDNHGIKEANVLKLLLPLGIQHTKLDSMLLADLSSYGTARGEVAHKSNYAIAKFADPKAEYDTAIKLVKDLKKLDFLITQEIERVNKLARV
jgi:hypothetical protein